MRSASSASSASLARTPSTTFGGRLAHEALIGQLGARRRQQPLRLCQLLLEAGAISLAVLGADREPSLRAGADHHQRGLVARAPASVAATVGRTRASLATTSAMASKASARSACSKRSSASSQVAGSMPGISSRVAHLRDQLEDVGHGGGLFLFRLGLEVGVRPARPR